MMGRQVAQGALFYGFQLDDHVPADHLLRRIDGLFDFSFDLTKATVWGFVFLVLFDVVLTFPKDQVLMQRVLSTDVHVVLVRVHLDVIGDGPHDVTYQLLLARPLRDRMPITHEAGMKLFTHSSHIQPATEARQSERISQCQG